MAISKCPKCENHSDMGYNTYYGSQEWAEIKWMFFCGHGYEVVMNFNRDTIKRLVESLL